MSWPFASLRVNTEQNGGIDKIHRCDILIMLMMTLRTLASKS